VNPIKLFKIWSLWEKLQGVLKENAPMKTKLPLIVGLLCSLGAALGLPALLTSQVATHLTLYSVLVSVAIALHSFLPSIFGGPSDEAKKAAGMTGVGMLLFVLLAGGMANAQTATPPTVIVPTNGFAGGSEAVALHFNGEWSAATIATESYDFIDFGKMKSNHVYFEGKELVAPTPDFNAYLGGITIEPDLSTLFQKTNVQPGAFSAFFSGAVGNGVPSVGGSHITFLVGGGVKYNLTGSLTWQALRADYGRFGSQQFADVSMGVSYIFGGKR
jgi:hypothetical protein